LGVPLGTKGESVFDSVEKGEALLSAGELSLPREEDSPLN